jgi:hypothetical protein
VWNLWHCETLKTPALETSKAAIRKRFTPAEMKDYKRLSAMKPACMN